MYFYSLDKIINGRYLVLENASLFQYFFDSDVNFSRYNFTAKQYTTYKFNYLNKNYKYFDYFIDIQTNFQQDASKINDFLRNNMQLINTSNLNKLLSINAKTEKKGNIIKNGTYFVSGYQVEFDKIDIFLRLLKRFNIKGFFYIDINVFNPFIFLNKSISNFIDLVLMGIGADSRRIRQYIESIGISVDNIIINLLNDEKYFNEVTNIIKQDIVWKYFQLLVARKIITLGKIYMNFYMITEEINGLHKNIYPVIKDRNIILENNLEFEAISYVELNKIQQDYLNPVAFHFWNVYKPYYTVGDRMNLLYEDDVINLKNILKV